MEYDRFEHTQNFFLQIPKNVCLSMKIFSQCKFKQKKLKGAIRVIYIELFSR